MNLGLGIVFSATDRASGAITSLSSRIGGLDAATRRAGSALHQGLGAAAAGALGRGLTSVTDAAAEFQFGMARVRNIAGATEEEFKQLGAAAIDAGLLTKFSPTEAVGGLEALAAVGFRTRESIQTLRPALDLAAGGNISVQQSAATTAAALNVFRKSASDSTETVDKLFFAASTTALQVQDMELAIGTVARGAGATKQSLDEMLVSMGLVKNTGVDTSVAASSVSSALLEIAKKSALFKKLGVDVTDSSGNFKNFMDIVVEASGKLDATYTNAAERAAASTKLFGRFGTTALVAVQTQLAKIQKDRGLSSMAEAAAVLRAEIGAAGGTAEKFVKSLNDTLQGQTTRLRGAVETVAVVVGEPLAEILAPKVGAVADAISNIARAIRDADPALKAAAARVAVMASAVLALGGGVATLRFGLQLALPALGAIVSGFGAAAVAAAPVALAVGFVAAAFRGLVQASGISSGAVVAGVQKVSLAFQAVVQAVGSGRFSGAVLGELDKVENRGVKRFAVGVAMVAHRIRQFFAGVTEGAAAAAGVVVPAARRLGDAFVGLGRALGLVSAVDATRSMPSERFFRAGATAGELFARALAAVADGMAFVVRFGSDVISGLRDGFAGTGSVFADAAAAAGGLATALGGTLSAAAGTGSESVGATIGRTVASLVVIFTRAATAVTRFATAVVDAVRPLAPVFGFLVDHADLLLLYFGGAGLLTKGLGLFGRSAGGAAVATRGLGGLVGIGGRLLGAFSRVGSLAAPMRNFFAAAALTFRLGGLRAIFSGIGSSVFSLVRAGTGLSIFARVGGWVSSAIMPFRLFGRGVGGVLSILRVLGGATFGVLGAVGRGMLAVVMRVPILRTALLALSGPTSAVVGALGRAGTALSGFVAQSGGLARVAGGLAAAAAAGYGLGTVLDRALGISDALSNSLANVSGVDHTGRVTQFDPTGEADSRRKFATTIAEDIDKSAKLQKKLSDAFAPSQRVVTKLGPLPGAERVGYANDLATALIKEFGSEEAAKSVAARAGGAGGKLGIAEARRLSNVLESQKLLRSDRAFFTAQDIEGQQSNRRLELQRAEAIVLANQVAQARNPEEALGRTAQLLQNQALAANAAERERFARLIEETVKRVGDRPIEVKINGDTIAVAAAEGARESAGRGFQTVPLEAI